MIPAGCTSLLQPLDTAINKPFKEWLREETDLYVEHYPIEEVENWTVSKRRITTTHVVAAAAQRLRQHAPLVKKAFVECGISIAPDGSEDHLIKIKDIDAGF
ncbi:hypothetical protein LTR60_001599, partial [Cryomyces antarcticus]